MDNCIYDETELKLQLHSEERQKKRKRFRWEEKILEEDVKTAM
jgi:hypothetical protein